MGLEHFYWFVDRAVVDPLLETSWRSFLRKHPRRRADVERILAFALEPKPDPAAVADILARRTLRWTMKRATPAYFFLNELISLVPQLKRRSPEVWGSIYETAILVAASCEAFLRREIDERTLWAVYNITGRQDPQEWLRLSRAESEEILQALGYGAVEKPIFRWQTIECLQEGYSCLLPADTRRFITFLQRAEEENWPAPRIRSDIKRELNWADRAVPRFRDVGLTRALARSVKRIRFVKPCALRYFG
jgi:hypothetical protein